MSFSRCFSTPSLAAPSPGPGYYESGSTLDVRLVSLTRPSNFPRRWRNCAPLQGEQAMTSLHGADVLIQEPSPASTFTMSSFQSASMKDLWTTEFASRTVRLLGDRAELSRKRRPLPRSRVARTRQIALMKEREKVKKSHRKYLPPMAPREGHSELTPPQVPRSPARDDEEYRFVPPVSSRDKDEADSVRQLDTFKLPRFEIRC